MKRYFVVGFLLFLMITFGWLNGLRLTEESAINVVDSFSTKIKVVSTVPTYFGKSVTYEVSDIGTFGVAHLERYLGVFWRHAGGAFGEKVEPDKPFKAIWNFSRNEKGKEQYVLGVKVVNPEIKYIVIGTNIPNQDAFKPYSLTLSEVKSHPDIYDIKEVNGGYVTFVANNYTEGTWTIRAFNNKGDLVADKLFASDVRYIGKGK